MSTSERRRTAPRDRFAGSEKLFNLDRAFDQLPDESVARQGHMQKVLYRHGNVTTGIFAFEAGGGIHQHTVDGESNIHVLEGELHVQTPQQQYTLGPGDLLLLDPAVPHDLKAVKATRMLMTVALASNSRDQFPVG